MTDSGSAPSAPMDSPAASVFCSTTRPLESLTCTHDCALAFMTSTPPGVCAAVAADVAAAPSAGALAAGTFAAAGGAGAVGVRGARNAAPAKPGEPDSLNLFP